MKPPRRRRLLLQALAGGAVTLGLGVARLKAQTQALRGRDPFTLGVASGYPTPEGLVLWTRLAPAPLEDGGGLGAAPIDVDWELAQDEAFGRIAARGRVQAVAEDAHALHVEVQGLQPGRPYWYRFTAAGVRSPVGRTRTAPAADSRDPLRLAFGSCQQYEQGFYAAHRDLAAQNPDLVVHLGDYIYESSWGSRHVRKHGNGIPTQLEEFRARWALYKSDQQLQAAHAAAPWCVIWDDHELVNDYSDDVAPSVPDPAQLLARRAAAYRAWYEHMPVPAAMRPQGPRARIHTRLRFGQQLDLLLLDGRQYRSHPVCLPGRSTAPRVDCAARLDPARSYLGAAQEAWLAAELAQPAAKWTLLAQPTLMAEADYGTGEPPAFWIDGWDGFPAARRRLLDALAARRPRNALVISGDVHAFWAADLRKALGQPVLATEFVGGSFTSQGPSAQTVAALMRRNPHLRWGNGERRGYALMTLDTRRCGVEFRAVDNVMQADSATRTLARFAVADGEAGVNVESS